MLLELNGSVVMNNGYFFWNDMLLTGEICKLIDVVSYVFEQMSFWNDIFLLE